MHDHEHIFSPYGERSRFAGTWHYPCTVPGCRVISLDHPTLCDCGHPECSECHP